MHLHLRKATVLSAVMLTMWAHLALAATEENPVARQPVAQVAADNLSVIVKLRSDGAGAAMAKLSNGATRTAALAKRTGLTLQFRREISERMLAGNIELSDTSAAQVLEQLRADAAVEYVAIDQRRFPHATDPNDALFANQWYLKDTEVSAVNAIGAWDSDRGSAGVVIAVLDTGVLYDHPDLGRGDRGGKLLPGFDFVGPDHMSNDGNTRDADPSDPGDWIDSSDKDNPIYTDCEISGKLVARYTRRRHDRRAH